MLYMECYSIVQVSTSLCIIYSTCYYDTIGALSLGYKDNEATAEAF